MDGITDLMDMSLTKVRKLVMDREAWHAAVHGVAEERRRPFMLGAWKLRPPWAPVASTDLEPVVLPGK